MDHRFIFLLRAALLPALFALSAATSGQSAESPAAPPADSPSTLSIEPLSDTRTLSVMTIADNVHVALGYGSTTMAMIEGEDGVVIIDSLASETVAAKAMEAFREITGKPVQAVILTHRHQDHSGGLGAVLGGADIPVYNRPAPRQERNDTFPHDTGNEPPAAAGEHHPGDALPAHHLPVSSRQAITIAGLDLELVPAKGDDNQQLWLWYPAKGVLFSGDGFYTSFPAIHALGDVSRETRDWLATLDAMLMQSPRFLVTGHGYPIIGAEQSIAALKDYRDAIALVLEETLAGIDRGLGPDALVAAIALPPELDGLPYLEQRFSRLSWAVRAIYTDRKGWFDGNPTHLDAMPPATLATRIAELSGGAEVLFENGLLALDNGDYRWAAQLADYLMALDPDNPAARHMKADALVGLASETATLAARDFYLQEARVLRQSAIGQEATGEDAGD
ncbi:MAG: alkyl sulfatase dimerization domain-containing protein [Porticoccaceae bacterium]